MKKLFFAVAALALVACGNKSAESEALSEAQADSLNTMVEEIQAVVEANAEAVPAEVKELVEKAAKGEISEEEKTTLWKRLKNIGSSVVLGDKSAAEGATDALNEIKNAEAGDVEDAAAAAAAVVGGEEAAAKVNNAVEKAQEVKQQVDETKEKAENVKSAVEGVKNAVDAFKKK